MKFSKFWLFVLFVCVTKQSTHGAVTITARQKNQPQLISIDESVVYRALTVIEGDILLDKYCECTSERECRNMKRSVIELTK